MASPKPRDVLFDPIFNRNPIALLVLGICSALAVTTKLETALIMTVSVTVVLAFSSAAISMIREHVPGSIRIFVQISIIATLVIVVDQLLQAFFFLLTLFLQITLFLHIALLLFIQLLLINDICCRHFSSFIYNDSQCDQDQADYASGYSILNESLM